MTHSAETEKGYEAQIAALQAERDELQSALEAVGAQLELISVSEYREFERLAAKGLAERETYPLPKSVTTSAGFYELMAREALNAMSLRSLLERVEAAMVVARTMDPSGQPPLRKVVDDPILQEDPAVSRKERRTDRQKAAKHSTGRGKWRFLRGRLPRIVVTR